MSRPTNLGQSRGGSSRTKGAPLGSRGEMTARNSAAGGTDNEYAFLTRSSAGAGFDSSFSCANCLNLTHQLMPSGLPLIGPLYPGLKCFHGVSVQESFFLNIKWCLCYAGGAFVTLLPILVDWPKMLNYPFDISYAVITYLFVAGQTVGQTNKYVWQAVVGSLTAAVAPHLAVTTFAQDGSAQAGAAGWFSVAVFLFFYVLVVLTLPMEKITKKFALIICIHFLMRKACIADSAFEPNSQCDATSQDVEQWSAVTFRMLLQGLWGCVPALVSVVLQGSFAMWEADKCAKKAIALLKLTLEPLLRSFADEVTALNCARIDMYFAEIDDNIQRAERALGDAYFEPFSGESVRSTTAILDVACKLRSTLIGMSEALRVKDKRGFDPTVHKQLVAEMRAPVFSILNQSLQLLDTELGAIRNPTRYHVTSLAPKPIEGEEQTEEMAFWRSRAQSDEIKGKLEKELNRGGALEKTKEEKKHFHAALSRLRTSPLTSKADMDSVFMMFLFNLTGFTQELLEFPDSFASSLQRQQSDKSWFEADTKMVALQFSKKQIIAAMKTAIAITVAASVNTYYDYNPFAPIMMAYLMAGHIGSSYATTQQRVVGLIVGTISSFFFMNLTRCEPWWTAIGFTIIVLIATYIASSNSDSAYTCQVCCVVAAVIMVRRIQTLDGNGRCRSDNVPFLEEQFEIIVQVVLSCVLLAVHEMVLWPTSSLVSLQKSVSDTITECKEAFMQLSTIPETIYGSTMKNGDAEEKKTTLDPLLMQTTIWNRIPRQLRKQRVYFREALAEPTLWDDEFPASAYKRILGTNDRLGMCMMGLCGAWNRLNILVNKDGDDLDSETGASQTANPLIIERQHVRREDLKLNDPRSRLVKVKVKSKIGDISQVKKLCQSALYSMKIRDDDMILAIKPDPSAKNTRMRVSLPMMSPKELKDLQSMLLEHNIYLNIKRKKILQHPNSQLRKEEIVVIAVRMVSTACLPQHSHTTLPNQIHLPRAPLPSRHRDTHH